MTVGLFLAAATAIIAAVLVNSNELDGKEGDSVESELAELTRLTVEYAGATDEEAMLRLRDLVHAQREKIASRGRSALASVRAKLEHPHKNVRRGAAITCYMILENEKQVDMALLKGFLEHMVREGDLKCRSNLRHVVLLIVRNLRSEKSD